MTRVEDNVLEFYQLHWVELYRTEVSFYKEVLKDPFVKQGLFELEKISNPKIYVLGRPHFPVDRYLSQFEDEFLEPLMRKTMQGFKKKRKHKFPDGFLANDVDARWHINNLWRMGFFTGSGRDAQRIYARCLELFFNRLLVMTEVCGRESKSLKKTSFYSELSFFHELHKNLEGMLAEQSTEGAYPAFVTARARLFEQRHQAGIEGENFLLKKTAAFENIVEGANILQLKNLPEVVGVQPNPSCRTEIEVTCNHIPELLKIWNDAGYRRWLSVISEKDREVG